MATILLVEDHAMSRQVLNTLLSYMGHRVLEAAEGAEALAIARAAHPDLVISDILLPTMDGIEFVRQLRTDTTQARTPVIFYTAWCRHPEGIHLDQSLGPCRIISKPSEPPFILQTVNELLEISTVGAHPQPVENISSSDHAKTALSQSAELQLSVLMDLSYSMVAERNAKQLLNTFSRAVRDMLNCRQSLLTVKVGTKAAYYYPGQGDDQPTCSCPDHLLPPEDILEDVAAKGVPVRWGKTPETGMVVPFASPGGCYGWISLMDKMDGSAFSKQDEEIAMALSTQAALAHENILLVEQLQKSNETKGLFITNISHEMRTPLNILLSNAQLLKVYLQNDKILDRDKLLEKINMQIRNCNRLLRLVNNFIDITKIDSHYFELRPVKCNIVEIVEAITLSVVEYAGTKGIDLVFDTEDEEMMLACDLDSIERIILNLLSNAIKFTPEGGSIYVSLKKHNDCIQISIKDTGIGISADKLDVIFERFRQVDNLMTRKNEGSGIGLTLVKLLTEMHGGRVRVCSEYRKGSEFIVELPINRDIKDDAVSDHVVNSSVENIIQRIQIEFSDIYF